jgi:hypothetical protein
LIPWNWFKKEEEDAGKIVPVKPGDSREQHAVLSHPLQQFHHEIGRLFDDAGRFSRLIGLPGDVDAESVDAEMVNGFLAVAISTQPACKDMIIETAQGEAP